MVKKQEYQLQDVVLGLRPEYQKLMNKLDELSEYVDFPKKEISNLKFYITNRDSKKLLWCQFKRNRPRFLEEAAKILGLEQKLFFHGKVNKKDNHWQIEGKEASQYPILDSSAFDQLVNDICQMPFVEEGQTKINHSDHQELFFSLWTLELLKSHQVYSNGMMQYHPDMDLIFLSPQPNFDQIDWVLRTSFSRDLFSPYQQSLIDHFIEKGAKLLVEDSFANVPAYYTIDEQPGLVLLKKVNRTK